MKEPIDFADRLVWKSPDLNVLRRNAEEYPLFSQLLQNAVQNSDAHGQLTLPDLRAFRNEAVSVFSDYGGESSGGYYTYSALVCGFGYTGPFNQNMKAVREKHKLGEIEIAYKSFGTGQVRRALPDYLEAINRLPGMLCTLLVDKGITTLLGPQEKETLTQLSNLIEAQGFGKRNHRVAEKLLRVVHFTAFLTGLLIHDGQKVFWMSDNDAICANQETHKQLLAIFDSVLYIYTRSGCAIPLVGGARPFKPPSLELMDLLSSADVAAGSLSACFPKQGSVSQGDLRLRLAETTYCSGSHGTVLV